MSLTGDIDVRCPDCDLASCRAVSSRGAGRLEAVEEGPRAAGRRAPVQPEPRCACRRAASHDRRIVSYLHRIPRPGGALVYRTRRMRPARCTTIASTPSYGFGAINIANVLADAGLEPRRHYFIVLDELWRALRAGQGMVDRVDAVHRSPDVAVVGGPGPAHQHTGPLDRHRRGTQLGERGVHRFVDDVIVSVLSETLSKSPCSFPMISTTAADLANSRASR